MDVLDPDRTVIDRYKASARYTGQKGPDECERIESNPPDILPTTFMMFEMLMTRRNDLDRKALKNCRGLRFVVLDELYTCRGRQGADRRSEAAAGAPEERRAAVAQVASKIFSAGSGADAIVTETLRRVTRKIDPRKAFDFCRGPEATPTGNINAPSMMIGKRASDLMLRGRLLSSETVFSGLRTFATVRARRFGAQARDAKVGRLCHHGTLSGWRRFPRRAGY